VVDENNDLIPPIRLRPSSIWRASTSPPPTNCVYPTREAEARTA
jgi:hypothetical protein